MAAQRLPTTSSRPSTPHDRLSAASPSNSDSDSDSSIAALLTSPTAQALQTARLASLKASLPHSSAFSTTTTTSASPTLYATHTVEKPLMHILSAAPTSILHFFSPPFPLCATMDKCLAVLARLHPECVFARIDVADAPFLVGKLGIRVLPVVMGFVAGEGTVRCVGFEGLGLDGREWGVLKRLEERFVDGGVLGDRRVEGGEVDLEVDREDPDEGMRKGEKGIRRGRRRMEEGEVDDDDDWD